MSIAAMERDHVHLSVERLVHESWWNTDRESGADGERFFTEDGVMSMPAITVQGREKIRVAYQARLAKGPRLSRHLVHNFVARQISSTEVEALYCVLLYAKNGDSPMEATHFQAICDAVDTCVLKDGEWLLQRRVVTTIFIAPDHDSIMLVSPGKKA